MKTYTATVVISFAVDVEVEAENEDQARQLLDEKAWEMYYKTSGESELYDFAEVTPDPMLEIISNAPPLDPAIRDAIGRMMMEKNVGKS